MVTDHDLICLKYFLLHFLLLYAGLCGEYVLQRSVPCIQCLCKGNGYAAVFKGRPVGDLTDQRIADGKLAHLSVRNLADDVAPARCEEVSGIHIVPDLYAHMVSEGHLADSLCHAMALHRICGNDPSSLDILKELSIALGDLAVYRKVISVFFDLKYNDLISSLLKFRRNGRLFAGHIHSKGNQCGRNVDFLSILLIEGAGHAVLAADGRKAKSHLGIVCAQ